MEIRSQPAADPLDIFAAWLGEAEAAEPNDPTAMALATVGEDGMPACRMVLLKGYDAAGFVFYTNYESRKGRHLLATPKRSEEHTSELQSLMRISYAVFRLQKNKRTNINLISTTH